MTRALASGNILSGQSARIPITLQFCVCTHDRGSALQGTGRQILNKLKLYAPASAQHSWGSENPSISNASPVPSLLLSIAIVPGARSIVRTATVH